MCLSVFLSVQAITFELLHIETSFLVCRYIFTTFRSRPSIKVIGSWSNEKNDNGYSSLIRSRSHIKVKVTSRSK